MKIRIVGGPVEGKVEVETAASANFATIMVLAEGLIGKGTLHDKYQFYKCEVVDKKAKAVGLLNPNDTPTSVQLPATGALIMLKAISGSPVGTPRDAPTSAVAPATAAAPASDAVATSTSAKGKKLTYRERIVAMYEAYDPSKVGGVESTLEKYKGKEDAVLKKLIEKYGPEPGSRAEEASTHPAAPGASSPQPPSSSPSAAATAVATGTPRQRIVAMYQKYDPSKVSSVDSVLEKFKGKEDAVLRKLVEKYGPEPPLTVEAPTVVPVQQQQQQQQAKSSSTTAVDKSPPPAAVANEKSIRDRIVALYQHYDPSKVDTVDATLEKYKGKEEAVLKKVMEKYGPEIEASRPPPAAPPAKAPPAAATSPVPEANIGPQHEQPIRGRGQSLAQPSAADAPLAPLQATSSDARARSQSVTAATEAAAPQQQGGPAPTSSAAPPPAAARDRGESLARNPREVEVPPCGGDCVSESPPPTVASVPSPQPPPPFDAPPQPDVSEAAVATPASVSAVTSQPPQEPPSRFKGMDPRFVSLVASVMRRVWEEANHHVMRFRFDVWRRHALEQAAERLLSDGVWELDADGKHYVHKESQYKTESLVAFLQQQGTARSQVLSKAMSHVLRKLIRATNALSSEPSTARLPVAFHDDDSTVTRLQNAVSLLEESAVARSELAQVRTVRLHLVQELASTKEQLQLATGRLTMLEPLTEKCQSLERDLSATKATLLQSQSAAANLDSQLKAVMNEFEKTQKELQKERRGLPTDMEAVIKVKDERIAHLEQQLAKSRLKLKCESASQQRFVERIRELESDVCLLERSREVVGFTRRQSVPAASSPSPRLLRRSAEQDSCTPRTGRTPPTIPAVSSTVPPLQTNLIVSSSHLSSEAEVDVSAREESQRFEPSPRRPPVTVVAHPSSARERELAELALKSDILQQELQQENAGRAKRENAGNCPHCDTALTALRRSSDGGDSSEAMGDRAFCFSCRRSFTSQDLHRFAAASARASVRNKAKR